ncbi:hypothetical protein VZT92_012905 [Zoarces viviparus]|uniref:Uncharacterized protein n=1 Tax=Zoarces viviparus TaxID=48416 RepID=A0AAW1F5F7_ZOAVI
MTFDWQHSRTALTLWRHCVVMPNKEHKKGSEDKNNMMMMMMMEDDDESQPKQADEGANSEGDKRDDKVPADDNVPVMTTMIDEN